jgi:glycosyltransferase involved in cell wall biosynthesis
VYQYIPALASAGFEVTVRPFFTPDFFRIVYEPGRRLRKAALFAREMARRLALLALRRRFDLFLVYREALPIGPPFVELALARTRALVFDFDDAIYLPNWSAANHLVRALKCPEKTFAILRASTGVVAGNRYLAERARSYNDAVTVIPTCVDTTKFVPRPGRPRDGHDASPTVGWIGSHTTAKYLHSVGPVLETLAARRRFRLHVVGTPERLAVRGVDARYSAWRLEREIDDFADCDVGIYPLWDDEWTRGKCGFKAIQFMACGVPVVAAAVGVNREIIEDGVNGFLAATPEEWVEKLQWLLADAALREKLGQAGRRTVEERYSLAANAPALIATLNAARLRAAQVGRG